MSKETATNWPAVIAIVLPIVLAIVGATHFLDSEIDTLGTHVTKLEGAVKYLGDQQSDTTKQVIHDLLAAASEAPADKSDAAIREIKAANNLLATIRNQKLPTDEAYFREIVPIINRLSTKTGRPEISDAVHTTRLNLAEYRSSTEPPPQFPKETRNLDIRTGQILTSDLLQGRSVIRVPSGLTTYPGVTLLSDGVVLDATAMKSGDILTVLPRDTVRQTSGASMALAAQVNGLVFLGSSQTLDNGITWENVVFVNVHIKYAGGGLALKNVHFVNCTFDVPDSPQGDQLLDATILGLPSLTVG